MSGNRSASGAASPPALDILAPVKSTLDWIPWWGARTSLAWHGKAKDGIYLGRRVSYRLGTVVVPPRASRCWSIRVVLDGDEIDVDVTWDGTNFSRLPRMATDILSKGR